MCTFLGAGAELDPSDVDDDRIASAAVTYLEGYLWDEAAAKDAVRARPRRRTGRGPQGRAHALRSVLRRAAPRRVPRADRVRRRHPLRQRARDHDALRGRHLRRGGRVASTAHCEIAALTRGAHGLGDRRRRRAARRSPRTRSTGASTPPAPATSTRPGFLYGLTHGHDLADVRAARLARRGRGDLAPRRRGRRRRSPSSPRPLLARLMAAAPPLPHRRRRARSATSPSSSRRSATSTTPTSSSSSSSRRCASRATARRAAT